MCNLNKWTHTPVVQWEQLVGRIQGRPSELYRQTDCHKTEKQPEQQQQKERCHSHWHHNLGLTGNSLVWKIGQQDSQLQGNDKSE